MAADTPLADTDGWLAAAGYPALLATTTGLCWALTGAVDPAYFPLVAGVCSSTATLLVAIWEWSHPYNPDWTRPRGDLVSDLVLTLGVLPVLVVGAEHGWRWVLAHAALPIWPTSAPVLLQLVSALLVCELTYYAFHRACHTWVPLWRFHAVHHGSQRVWWGNSGRFHPVDAGLGFALYFLPLVAFGVPARVVALIVVINATTGLLEHANVPLRLGWLNRIFNSAELHRHHHARSAAGDVRNLGKVLSVWDQVFGTYTWAPQPPTELGADVPARDAVPASLLGALRFPFG